MSKLLLVEDDQILSQRICELLTSQLFIVDAVVDGPSAMAALRSFPYDIVIMDWDLPEMSGMDVVREYRAIGGCAPVLMLTGKTQIEEKLSSFGAGVDDYLTKPFDSRELVARLHALSHRRGTRAVNVLTCGSVSLDPASCRVQDEDRELPLSPKEFALLKLFLSHPEEVFSAQSLLERAWGYSSDSSIEAVRVHINRLRSKLSGCKNPPLIANVYGLGYRLESSVKK